MSKLTRREMLKLMAASIAGMGLSQVRPLWNAATAASSDKPNVLILLFDAMSAQNLSVYGYPRPTTPNLERFAQRATVYHSHYSASNFTTPGTASMLTGLYPWHHRALSDRSLVRRDLNRRSFYHVVDNNVKRVGFSQNLWADLFLRQFADELDEHIPSNSFSYKQLATQVSQKLTKDSNMAYYAVDEFLASSHNVISSAAPGSALWGYLDISYGQVAFPPPSDEYPYSMPSNGYSVYQHPQLFDGLGSTFERLARTSEPWFGYFHVFSPHPPYAPRRQFIESQIELKPPFKKSHPLASFHASWPEIKKKRNQYDAFIADVDFEFGRLLDRIESAGIRDSTYIIVTADHGELFERGEYGHGSPLLYDPVIHIPLLVSAPGQASRQDVYAPTSNADILPTLALLFNHSLTQETDGKVLAGLGGMEEKSRGVLSMVARSNSAFLPIQTASLALMKEEWKLIHYFGYNGYPDSFELYNLRDDPQEQRDLISKNPSVLDSMKQEMLDSLEEANRPYRR